MGSSRNIRRRVNCIMIILLLSLLYSTNQITIQTRAQIYFPSYLGISSLVPFQEQENLRLVDSNIILRTELHNIRNDSMISSFTCNYTITNHGPTVNGTFVIAMSSDIYYYVSTVFFGWVNGTYVTIDTLKSEYRSELDSHFGYYPYCEYLLLNNTILQGYSNTSIDVSFDFTVRILADRSERILDLFYDVGSFRRLWDNYQNVRVEYLVTGVQPFSYLNYSDTTPERKCDVKTYEDETSYLWHWEDEEIIENTISAKWLIPREKPFTFLVNWDTYGILIFAFSTFLLMSANKIKKKSKED